MPNHGRDDHLLLQLRFAVESQRASLRTYQEQLDREIARRFSSEGAHAQLRREVRAAVGRIRPLAVNAQTHLDALPVDSDDYRMAQAAVGAVVLEVRRLSEAVQSDA